MKKEKIEKLNLLKDECWFCGNPATEKHEIFFGSSNRKLSIEYGLMVNLCHICHRDNTVGVHGSRSRDLQLKRYGQTEFEKMYSKEEFMKIFGRNYL